MAPGEPAPGGTGRESSKGLLTVIACVSPVHVEHKSTQESFDV
jgi:hypothetical protein